MAATKLLVDTGPLVAYLNRRDRHHRWAVDCFATQFDPLLTCEAVLSEAVFLLQSQGAGAEPVLQLVERNVVQVVAVLDDHRPDVFRLLRKYADRPMSLADGCLVRMAEVHEDCRVFTTDRDFRIYRRNGRQVIPLLSPFQGR
jgi:predicted nucleic acid-binding protein